MKSEKVGVSTLKCLFYLSKHVTLWENINKILDDYLFTVRIGDDLSLIDGAAGYLYVLLYLESKTWNVSSGKSEERDALIKKLRKKIHQTSLEVFDKSTETITQSITRVV